GRNFSGTIQFYRKYMVPHRERIVVANRLMNSRSHNGPAGSQSVGRRNMELPANDVFELIDRVISIGAIESPSLSYFVIGAIFFADEEGHFVTIGIDAVIYMATVTVVSKFKCT